MTKLVPLALLFAVPQTSLAQAPQCVSRQEMADMIAFAAPIVVEAAASRCSAALPATAFLRTRGPELTQRLRGEAQGSDESLPRVLVKLGGGKMPEGLSAQTMQLFARDMLTSMLTKEIKPESCDKVDALIESLEPLPARNLGTAVATLVELTTKPGGKSNFKICPEPRR